MIEKVIEHSANHPRQVLIAVLAASLCGWWALRTVPVDALPDLSDTQVIVYSRWDRSPDLVESQVTYPIITALLGGPRVKSVRGISDFGASYVYVIFEDGTDLYWARSRTLEYLASVASKLPSEVKTELGPDATGLGWVYQYVLRDRSGQHSLDELRSYQDWYLRYYLKAVPGVADVASLGGYVREYQVNVDPNRLRAYGISINRVVEAVRAGNNEVGGRLIEFGGTEYMVRGRGYARSLQDFGEIVLTANDDGSAVRIKDIGQVILAPALRRGVSDLDGRGEAVSGIVVMRQGQNTLDVIRRVQDKLRQIAPGLPAGVTVDPIYDRSQLIRRVIANLKTTLIEIAVTVSLVILLFLGHVPSAIIPVITIPLAVLIAFIPFRILGLSANIMSLAGIAIAIGALVDASIVVVEQAQKKREEAERTGDESDHRRVILNAMKQVGRPGFYALLVLAVSFLPVLTLEAEEGRLFKPLAYTKSLSMMVAAILAVTLVPALRLMFTGVRNSVPSQPWLASFANTNFVHPLNHVLIRCYRPIAEWSLRRKWAVLTIAIVVVAATVPVFRSLGSEFMPPLDEGALLYMPSTLPGISMNQAQHLLEVSDRIIQQFPEVDHVLGKAGRAETPTDPAPPSMFETLIILKPRSEWPGRISTAELVARLDNALKLPGLSNAWTMPIKGRIDMLSTGIRTMVGLKIYGADAIEIERVGSRIESLLTGLPGAQGVFAERTGGGYFLDIDWDRESLARLGLSIDEADGAIRNAIGGETVTTTVEGRARYPVSVRYMRDFRSDTEALGRVLVSATDGRRHVPLSDVARIHASTGPAMLRDENGLLTGYVYVNLRGRDPAGFIAEAQHRLDSQRDLLPAGYSVAWSGEFEAMARVRQRLTLVLPATLAVICLLLYANLKSATKTLIILLGVPFSAVGAVWSLYLLGYQMSIGVWVGIIALLGVDAETGIFMLLYLDLAYERALREGRMNSPIALREAVLEGAVQRIRPKIMTVSAMALGLAPVMWSNGTGADVMKRIAAPMVGGIFTSFLLELVIFPVVYELWRSKAGLRWRSAQLAPAPTGSGSFASGHSAATIER